MGFDSLYLFAHKVKDTSQISNFDSDSTHVVPDDVG